MRDECLISLKERDFGGISGRLEYISFLSEKGLELARGKEILSAHAKYITDKTAESIFIDHDLLVNWFFIHLIQIERETPRLGSHVFSRNRSTPAREYPQEPHQTIPMVRGHL